MKMRMGRGLMLYQWAAGLCDASTGALLIGAPRWTLHLMGLHILPEPIAFVRLVGAFVGGVGASYLWAALCLPVREWRGQWSTTALIRSGVALLLTWQIATGAMERGWAGVVATDALLAIVQWIGISKDWLRDADGR
jgi:hypothetical protein